MSKMKKQILPASGHNLWVAFYDSRQLNVPEKEEDLPLILEVYPVIGWLYRGKKRLLLEVTPIGPVETGIVRLVGESRAEARALGMESLSEAWQHHRKSAALRATRD